MIKIPNIILNALKLRLYWHFRHENGISEDVFKMNINVMLQ